MSFIILVKEIVKSVCLCGKRKKSNLASKLLSSSKPVKLVKVSVNRIFRLSLYERLDGHTKGNKGKRICFQYA